MSWKRGIMNRAFLWRALSIASLVLGTLIVPVLGARITQPNNVPKGSPRPGPWHQSFTLTSGSTPKNKPFRSRISAVRSWSLPSPQPIAEDSPVTFSISTELSNVTATRVWSHLPSTCHGLPTVFGTASRSGSKRSALHGRSASTWDRPCRATESILRRVKNPNGSTCA
jgi:hypothetical protein